MAFFTSSVGHYTTQVLVHSVLTALVIEVLLRLWRVGRPATVAQFRLLYLLLPLLGWPVYQLLWPARGSDAFRQQFALIDTQAWLPLSLVRVPGWGWLLVLMAAGTLLFVSRALIPTLYRHLLDGGGEEVDLDAPLAEKLRRSIRALGLGSALRVGVVDDGRPAVYVSGVSHPRLMVTVPLVDMLDEEEIEAVLAHEEAHALRRDNLRGWALLLLGLGMFYSPVAVVALQRIGQDVETACDDAAVNRVRRPLALASALIRTTRAATSTSWEAESLAVVGWPSRLNARVHRSLVARRVHRLARYRPPEDVPLKWPKLSLTALMLAGLLFFVV